MFFSPTCVHVKAVIHLATLKLTPRGIINNLFSVHWQIHRTIHSIYTLRIVFMFPILHISPFSPPSHSGALCVYDGCCFESEHWELQGVCVWPHCNEGEGGPRESKKDHSGHRMHYTHDWEWQRPFICWLCDTSQVIILHRSGNADFNVFV